MTTNPYGPVRYQRLRAVLSDITYRPGYDIESGHTEEGGVWFEVVHERPDADTGVVGIGRGGKRWLGPCVTTSDIIRNVFGALMAYEEHEVREFFLYQGQRLFSPHMDLLSLAEAMEHGRVGAVDG